MSIAWERAPAGGAEGYQGVWYEGGQFMPVERDEAPAGSAKLLTEGQQAYQARLDLDRRLSTHQGVVGQKITVPVVISLVRRVVGFYGVSYLTVARDQGGNVYVSKGVQWAREGDHATICATVKEHSERDGVKQTVIQRVKCRLA